MDFYKRISIVCSRIPKGRVATYGQIALLCGKPNNSRQVGYALNHEMCGIGIPAHRIVNHQGYLSGSAAFAYPDTQQSLLESEGVEVSQDLRVKLIKYGWKNTMEEALDLRKEFEHLGL